MCLPGGGKSVPQDNSAEIVRQQEEERQKKIAEGRAAIDTAFTPYNDGNGYYRNIRNSYESFYNPQLDDQYNDAQEKTTYGLGRQGILQSDIAGEKFGKLKERYDTTKQSVASQALAAANAARAQVAQAKQNLYALNESSADPSLARQSASSAIAGLNTSPSFTPLGDIFAGLIAQGTNAAILDANNKASKINGYDFSSGLTGKGSGIIVR